MLILRTRRWDNTEGDTRAKRHWCSKGSNAEAGKQKGKSEERRRGTLKQRGSQRGVDTEGAREGEGVTEAIRV